MCAGSPVPSTPAGDRDGHTVHVCCCPGGRRLCLTVFLSWNSVCACLHCQRAMKQEIQKSLHGGLIHSTWSGRLRDGHGEQEEGSRRDAKRQHGLSPVGVGQGAFSRCGMRASAPPPRNTLLGLGAGARRWPSRAKYGP